MGQLGRWITVHAILAIGLFGCLQSTETTQLVPASLTQAEQSELDNNLLWAAERGDFATVKEAIQKGANVNHADPNGFSVLVNALSHYQLELIEYLILRGAVTRLHPSLVGPPAELAADPASQQTRQQELNEALLTAAEAHDIEEVKRLLDAGADINAADEDGFTVLVTALSSYQLDVVDYLVQHGATIAQI